jgi:hypothetical protein
VRLPARQPEAAAPEEAGSAPARGRESP